MRLYLEISGEKHYVDEDIVKEYDLHEGMITPYTGLMIKKEFNTNTEVVTTTVDETETSLPTVIDDSEINTDINEVADLEDSSDVVGPASEFSKGVKTPNEAPSKPEDTEAPIKITEDTGSHESSTGVTESVTQV